KSLSSSPSSQRHQQLTCNNSSTNILSEMCNNLVGLFDR
ncbi:unnamed protein product, partial [Rotaria sp. Silwood2]